MSRNKIQTTNKWKVWSDVQIDQRKFSQFGQFGLLVERQNEK